MYYGATTAAESQLHKSLVSDLADFLRGKGYILDAVDGLTNNQPNVVKNDGSVGDGENKMPDAEAHSDDGRIIRGEAKCGNGDIDSAHSITQYKLFSNLANNKKMSSWLFIIAPKSAEVLLEEVLSKNLSENQRNNIATIYSS